ncbi:response regulator transcription factor [Granulosicoccaceae sp. 1_MG-2023]|nr:response regulator transcription factor [Granulosicoccaceae sp. 1_MG-2023]
MRLNIGIVDDHQIVRAGFREMLSGQPDMAIAFEAASGEDALEQIRTQGCNVLLLDISLPGQSGVDVLRKVRQRYSETRVLILSGYPEDRYALSMMRNGANGYLCKDCESVELLSAIRQVARGKSYLSSRTAELLAETVTGEAVSEPHQSLSEREFQVFLKLAQGSSVSDIADDLNLSVKTISTYRSRLLEKMGVASNAELAGYAIRNGLIEA